MQTACSGNSLGGVRTRVAKMKNCNEGSAKNVGCKERGVTVGWQDHSRTAGQDPSWTASAGPQSNCNRFLHILRNQGLTSTVQVACYEVVAKLRLYLSQGCAAQSISHVWLTKLLQGLALHVGDALAANLFCIAQCAPQTGISFCPHRVRKGRPGAPHSGGGDRLAGAPWGGRWPALLSSMSIPSQPCQTGGAVPKAAGQVTGLCLGRLRPMVGLLP